MKETLFQRAAGSTNLVYELIRGAIVLAIGLVLVNLFLLTVSAVNGNSMIPTLQDDEYILVWKPSYYWSEPVRGQVVTFRFPGDPEQVRYVKRIIGLPGEHVAMRDGQLLVNGKPLNSTLYGAVVIQNAFERQLGKNEYFVMGDNRENSNDSRVFGPVERRFMIGQGVAVIWPLNKIRPILNEL